MKFVKGLGLASVAQGTWVELKFPELNLSSISFLKFWIELEFNSGGTMLNKIDDPLPSIYGPHSHVDHTTRRHKIVCNIKKTHKKLRLRSHMDHAANWCSEPHFRSVTFF